MPFDELRPGLELRTRGRTITETDLVAFSALTGDWHPAHSDARVAAQSPFGERVAHGMLLLSYALGQLPLDPARTVALREVRDVTFKRPAPIGTTIATRAVVQDVRPVDAGTGLVGVGLSILGDDDRLLARAGLGVLWRREAEAA
ncbi:MAG: dehydratase [Solirubrobacterales bacterium]|nr:dehydratase [Solirubrobacterales bacterium]